MEERSVNDGFVLKVASQCFSVTLPVAWASDYCKVELVKGSSVYERAQALYRFQLCCPILAVCPDDTHHMSYMTIPDRVRPVSEPESAEAVVSAQEGVPDFG